MNDDWSDDDDAREDGTVEREMYRGDTLTFLLQFVQPGTRAPQDMTGWFVQFTAKRQYADQDSQAVLVAKTTGSAPNVVTFPNGVTTGLAQISAAAGATVSLGDGVVRLVYDVQTIDPEGVVRTAERGRLKVLPDVTRAIVQG